jgi:hypothetical protein
LRKLLKSNINVDMRKVCSTEAAYTRVTQTCGYLKYRNTVWLHEKED